MQNYTIMPLDVEHLEEICQDIKEQYDRKIASCALFSMTLVPEGNPPIDKAGIMCEKYDLFRERLQEMGEECGILVQASIGHGYKLDQEFGYQKYVSLSTGEERNVCCPYDEGFRAHFRGVMKKLASHRPKVIMVDDDFRLMARLGKGCACPLHMKRLSEKIGEEITREELWEHTKSRDARSIEITKAFIETQGEALLGAAREMRAGIDEVDPSLPGVFCACGEAAEFAGEIAHILAGAGNPVTVRINNGNYTPAGARGLSHVAFRAAIQKIHMKEVGAILAETDTCPQNRYSTGAMSLHAHFTTSILEGTTGAKHWITRLFDFEPDSGKAYRRTLAKYAGFYHALADMVSQLKWVGANLYFTDRPYYGYENEKVKSAYWASCVLERMGIPMYYSSDISGAVFLDGDDVENYTEEECLKVLSGTVVLSGHSANLLSERGYGVHIGVEVREWNGPNTSYERIHLNGKKCSTQMQIRELVPLNREVEIPSTVYHLKDGKLEIPLFPGSTVYHNALGGNVIVFAGSPQARFHYTEAFSFLNESRKAQLVTLLKDSGVLPVYVMGDDEIYMKAAYMQDGNLFCAIFNTGFDPMEEILLCTEHKAVTVEQMNCDGVWQRCDFAQEGELLKVQSPAYTLQPVVLKITVAE